MAGASNRSLKATLVEELEAKKPFTAKWELICDLCFDPIEEGEDFFFFGDKKKICNECRDAMRQLIEEQV